MYYYYILHHRHLIISFLLVSFLLFQSCSYQDNTTDSIETDFQNMVLIPAGKFIMGGKSSDAYNNEFPRHYVKVDGFYMDCTEVTVAEFKHFVKTTGYVTQAEKQQPGSLVFIARDQSDTISSEINWWEWNKQASWFNPNGEEHINKDIQHHPVVNVTYKDACTYCEWKNKRLPTEAEWEWAAMGGIQNAKYPWTEQSMEKAYQKANYWQGHFPDTNYVLDGFYNTAPVKSFAANGYGLYDMGGNVWEWCADWYNVDYYKSIDKDTAINPKGAVHCHNHNAQSDSSRVLKGGSFLCNDSYCSGYRVSRRIGVNQNDRYNHTGFRCVKDLP